MNAEEIRLEAVERIARGEFDFEARPLTPAPEDWDALPPTVQDRYRRRAAFLVDALDDLLPAEKRWGVQFERWESMLGRHDTKTMTLVDESHARQAVERGIPFEAEDHRVVSRYVTDWTEVHG